MEKQPSRTDTTVTSAAQEGQDRIRHSESAAQARPGRPTEAQPGWGCRRASSDETDRMMVRIIRQKTWVSSSKDSLPLPRCWVWILWGVMPTPSSGSDARRRWRRRCGVGGSGGGQRSASSDRISHSLLALSISLSRSLALFLSRSLSRSLSCSRSLAHFLSLTRSLARSLACSLICGGGNQDNTRALSLSLTLSFSLSPSF
jgi:hypothetical protein